MNTPGTLEEAILRLAVAEDNARHFREEYFRSQGELNRLVGKVEELLSRLSGAPPEKAPTKVETEDAFSLAFEKSAAPSLQLNQFEELTED